MEKEKSCGCIIVVNNQVLLVKHNGGHWGFPKGHVEKNETEEQTAIREVKEETNLDVEIINNKRYVEEYITNKGRETEVVYFIAKKIGGEIKKQEEEIQEIKWFNIEEAIEMITYEGSRKIFKEAINEIVYEDSKK